MLITRFRQVRAAGPTHVVGPAVLVGLLVVILAGCHSYRPMVGADPAPGDDVRFRLSVAASSDISERVGTPMRALEGRVVRVSPDSLVLDASWGAVYAGTVFEGRRDTLSFHRSSVLEVDRREFSRTRTALVAGAALAVAIWVIRSLGVGTDTGDPDSGNPPVF